MAVTVTIGGTAFTLLARTLRIKDRLRVPDELQCRVRYTTGTQPAQGQEIQVSVDGTVLFTGVIILARRIDEAAGNRILFHIEAEDCFRNFRRVFLAKTWSNRTLKQILTDIVAEVPGVTLHPSQDDGPTLESIRSNYLMAHDLVRNLGDVTERLFHVDEQKRFRMHTLTEIAALHSLVNGAGDITTGHIDYDVDDSEYVNKVTVVGTPVPGPVVVEKFDADGSTTVFTLTSFYIGTPEVFVSGMSQSVSSDADEGDWLSAENSNEVTADTAPGAETFYIVDNSNPGGLHIVGDVTDLGATLRRKSGTFRPECRMLRAWFPTTGLYISPRMF